VEAAHSPTLHFILVSFGVNFAEFMTLLDLSAETIRCRILMQQFRP